VAEPRAVIVSEALRTCFRSNAKIPLAGTVTAERIATPARFTVPVTTELDVFVSTIFVTTVVVAAGTV